MSGNARIGAEMVAPGVSSIAPAVLIEFGELDGSETARARQLAEVFQARGNFRRN